MSEEFRISKVTDDDNDNFDNSTSNNDNSNDNSDGASDAAPIIGAIAGIVFILPLDLTDNSYNSHHLSSNVSLQH